MDARPSSPVPCFFPQEAETQTQKVKVMYMTALTETMTIGIYECNFKKWNKTHVNPRSGKCAKGVTAAFMEPVLRKLARDARRKLGAGSVGVWYDRATCFTANKELFEELFDEVQKAPAKSPDFSMNDAAVHPLLERVVTEEGAEDEAELKKVCKRVWSKLTPDNCKAAGRRVRRNMERSFKVQGGNFYHE